MQARKRTNERASDFVYVSQLIWVDPTVQAELFSIHLGVIQLLLEEKFQNFFREKTLNSIN